MSLSYPLITATRATPYFPEVTSRFLGLNFLSELAGGGVRRPYNEHVWVYACCNAIGDNIAGVDLQFLTGTEEAPRPLTFGPLQSLFQTPNPYMSGYDLIKATFVNLGIRGEAFWILDRESEYTLPREIWCFHPKRFEPVPDERTGLVRGFIYRAGQKTIPLQTHEVVWFKYYNPEEDWPTGRGLSPLDAARQSVDQDYWAGQYNSSFFKNSGVPSIILESKDPLYDDFDRVLAQYKDRHQGVSRAHGIALLEGGLTAKVIGSSHKDMDFLEGRKFNREEILGAYKVPKGELGIEDDTGSYAKDQVRRKLFWETSLLPKMGFFEFVIWSQFLRHLTGGNIWAEFDRKGIPALQEDLDTQLDRAVKLFGLGYSKKAINEVLDLGMPPAPDDEVGYLPFNLVPIGTESTSKTPPPGKGAEPAPAAPLPPPSVIQLQITRETPDPQIFYLQYAQLHAAMEKRVQGKVKKYFYEQRKGQLQRIEEKYSSILGVYRDTRAVDLESLLFDLEEANEKLQGVMWPLYLSIGEEAGKSLVSQLGGDPATFVLADTQAMGILQEKLIQVVGINDYTREKLRQTLLEGMENGETIRELQDRIREAFNFTESRSLVIARTETGQAAAPARDVAMGRLGVVKTEWGTAGDGVVRPSHVAIAGQQRFRGEVFSNGCLYPCDPSGPAGEIINCRCVAIPVVE